MIIIALSSQKTDFCVENGNLLLSIDIRSWMYRVIVQYIVH